MEVLFVLMLVVGGKTGKGYSGEAKAEPATVTGLWANL